MHGGAVDGIVTARAHATARLGVSFFLGLTEQKLRAAALGLFGDGFVLTRRGRRRSALPGLGWFLFSPGFSPSSDAREEQETKAHENKPQQPNAARFPHFSPEFVQFRWLSCVTGVLVCASH